MSGVVDMSLDQIIKEAKSAKKGTTGIAPSRNRQQTSRNTPRKAPRESSRDTSRRNAPKSVGLAQIKIRAQVRGRGGAAPRREIILDRQRNNNGREGRRGIRERVKESSVSVSKSWEHDRFERKVSPREEGPKKGFVTVENLNFSVSEQDLRQLFATAGDLLRATINFDAAGRSLGTAEVVYKLATDADEARRRFDNKKLDGQLIAVRVQENDFRKRDRLTEKRTSGDVPRSGRIERNRNDRKDAGGRGGRNRRGAGRVPRGEIAPTSADALDKDLDSYMTQPSTQATSVTPMV